MKKPNFTNSHNLLHCISKSKQTFRLKVSWTRETHIIIIIKVSFMNNLIESKVRKVFPNMSDIVVFQWLTFDKRQKEAEILKQDDRHICPICYIQTSMIQYCKFNFILIFSFYHDRCGNFPQIWWWIFYHSKTDNILQFLEAIDI